MSCDCYRVVALFFAIFPGFGCAELAAAGAVPRFAYVANSFDSSVSVFSVDASIGSLRHIGHAPSAKFPTAVAGDAERALVYVSSKVLDNISLYRSDAVNGKLTWLQDSTTAAGRSPSAIVLHPLKRLLYVAARGGSVLGFLRGTQNRLLTPVPGSPYPAGPRARTLVIHPNGVYVYVANPYSNDISAYRIDVSSGALLPVPRMPFPTGDTGLFNPALLPLIDAPPESGGAPYDVSIDPAGKFLYSANHYGGTVAAFTIDAGTGTLASVRGSPFKTGMTPHGVTVHPSGRFLYVPSFQANAVWAHRIDQHTGVLTDVAGSPFATGGEDPYEITFNAAGTLAYVPNHKSNSIAILRVNTQDGSLTLREQVQTRSGPQRMSFTAGERPLSVVSRYAYAVDAAAHQVVAYRVDGTSGALKEMSRAATGKNPAAATTSSDGKFVYVANAASNSVSAFRMDAITGQLSAVAQSPFITGITGQAPTALAADANGWFLYVANKDSNTLTVFAIDPASGALKALAGSTLATGTRPTSVALDSAARYAYVANAGADTISLFRYWTTDGPLVDDLKRAGAPFAASKTPVALAVDPGGNHLYAINQDANTISCYAIHFQSGVLKPLAGSPVATGSMPVAITIHPDGATVYVVNRKSRDIATYRRDPLTGVLKETAPRLPTGENPVSIALDATGRYAYVLRENSTKVLKYSIQAQDGRLADAKTEVMGPGTVSLIFDRSFE